MIRPGSARLLASLAGSWQQTPIVVVLSTDGSERYLVIDGYKRIAALEQLGYRETELHLLAERLAGTHEAGAKAAAAS